MKIATITMALVMAGLFAHAQGEPAATQTPAQPATMEQPKAETGHMNKKEKKHKKHGKKAEKAEKSEKSENTEGTTK
ncbi:MAG: hypothetical protein ACKOX6_07380 [Bdellovibrio sp.]